MKLLYVIEAVHLPPRPDGMRSIKIGVSAAVQRRLQDMQVGCPLQLRLLLAVDVGRHAHRLERTWHTQFDAYLISGREWFAVDSPTLRDMLQAITAGQQPDPDDICDTCTEQIPLARRRDDSDTVYCSARCHQDAERWRREGIKIHHKRTPVMIAILRKYGR